MIFRLFLPFLRALFFSVVKCMSFPSSHNIGGLVSPMRAADNTALTAGGAGDNTQVVGQILDRSLFGYPLSMAVALSWKAVLAAGKTLTMKSVTILHGNQANLSDATTLSAPADVIVQTDGGSGGTYRGCQKYPIDLASAGRYIQVEFTPDLNNTVTDTAEVAAQVIFGGADQVPV